MMLLKIASLAASWSPRLIKREEKGFFKAMEFVFAHLMDSDESRTLLFSNCKLITFLSSVMSKDVGTPCTIMV